MDSVFNRTDALSASAAFHLERTKVIQGNIANVDTPGYRTKELVFAEKMDNAMAMKTTDSRHLATAESSGKLRTVTLKERDGYDYNRVNMDNEMAKLAESSIMYKSTVESMKKELSKLQTVITGR